MKLYDISRVHQEALLYPGSDAPKIERVYDMNNGAAFNASIITTGSHIGTHADSTCHFVASSDVSIDQMSLDFYYGDCRVVTVPEDSLLTKDDFKGKIDNVKRLVIHGGGKSYLSVSAVEYFIEKHIATIVTDAWSVAPLDNEVEIHQLILSANMAIVENVVLDNIDDGDYILSAFPIKYGGCDGAPVRAVLIKE